MTQEISLLVLYRAIVDKYGDLKTAAEAMGYKDQSPLTRLLRQDPRKIRSDTIARIKKAFPDKDINQLLQRNNLQPINEMATNNEVTLLKELVASLKDQVKMKDDKINELECKLDKSKAQSSDFINDI